MKKALLIRLLLLVALLTITVGILTQSSDAACQACVIVTNADTGERSSACAAYGHLGQTWCTPVENTDRCTTSGIQCDPCPSGSSCYPGSGDGDIGGGGGGGGGGGRCESWYEGDNFCDSFF